MKDEIYRVAVRHGIAAVVVSNSGMRLPGHPLIYPDDRVVGI